MLQIKDIRKQYKTGNLVQKALDGVSLTLRENEFVAILGPSGSGKTTLLNIIGGLDRYDSGDLIIDGISTKKYKDRDWDSYRNHTIGFVFQSYNLIPHQTVLANVELALTISGVSKSQRRKRAKKALEQVGLGAQLHKKPSQMSGGQMQRVAIARALVNDPKIVLADEPTGALDSETSVQVMELLKEVAKDRLVVMVTHNPELAREYATRIVQVKDGLIVDDSNPVKNDFAPVPIHKNMGHASMSLLTALSLSFNNLRTKKARTLLTAFAGSIGIIGISLILSISNGVNDYIQSIEEDTLSEYPLQITSSSMNLSAMMGDRINSGGNQEVVEKPDNIGVSQMITGMLSRVTANDLQSLKNYLEGGLSGIEDYTKSIEYKYSAAPLIYLEYEGKYRQVNPDKTFSSMGMNAGSSSNSMMSAFMSTDIFHQLPENPDLFQNQYEIKAGRWPESEDELVIVLTSGGNISDFMAYGLGLRDFAELDEMVNSFNAGDNVEAPNRFHRYDYNELLGITYKLVNRSDLFEYDEEYKIWKDKSDDKKFMKTLMKQSEELVVVGVVKPSEDANATMLSSGLGYTSDLTRHVIEMGQESTIVKQQLKSPNVNVFTGNTFSEDNQQAFDVTSMFTINDDVLGESFEFDTEALKESVGESIDFSTALSGLGSSLNFSGINISMPSMPAMDFSDITSYINIKVNMENAPQLVQQLMEGYLVYAGTHPEADYSRLGASFSQYMGSASARQIVVDGIRNAILSGGQGQISGEQLASLILSVMSGFPEYLEQNGLNDPALLVQYLNDYLATPEVQQKLWESAAAFSQMMGQIEISQEQLQAIAANLLAGYETYAAENGLPAPSQIGTYMGNYLQTPEAQTILINGAASLVNLSEIQTQLGSYFATKMQGLGSSFASQLSTQITSQITSAMSSITSQIAGVMETTMMSAMETIGSTIGEMLTAVPEKITEAVKTNMDGEKFKEVMMSMMMAESASYDANLKKLGYTDSDKPQEIDIYPLDFDSKEQVLKILDDYNEMMMEEDENKVITYTDMVGTLMSSVTVIVDTISYVLIAFVAISLIVSSIMIGVITYISVLERRKEIGILRAIGASKRNISQVFNAETFIIGLIAGLMGIGLTLALLVPINTIIHDLTGNPDVTAFLQPAAAVILITLSIILTLIGGVIPSRKASQSDPVTALRSD